MKNLSLVVFLAIVIMACQPSKKETAEAPKAPTLTLKWETDTLLTTCESVIYDSVNDVDLEKKDWHEIQFIDRE